MSKDVKEFINDGNYTRLEVEFITKFGIDMFNEWKEMNDIFRNIKWIKQY